MDTYDLNELPTNDKIVALRQCIARATVYEDYAEQCNLGDNPTSKLDELVELYNECYESIVLGRKTDSKVIIDYINKLDESLKIFPEFKSKTRSGN